MSKEMTFEETMRWCMAHYEANSAAIEAYRVAYNEAHPNAAPHAWAWRYFADLTIPEKI